MRRGYALCDYTVQRTKTKAGGGGSSPPGAYFLNARTCMAVGFVTRVLEAFIIVDQIPCKEGMDGYMDRSIL